MMQSPANSGFTLIELSIVLVIIGLIIGGVLVGQDLVRAAEVRATISQIEKYNTAARTFYGKFGYFPGDLNGLVANQFGFTARGNYAGEGDGNGIIEGILSTSSGSNNGNAAFTGECGMFWVDLSSAAGGHLIDGSFTAATPTTIPSANVVGTNIGAYFPTAKLGRGNSVYVWSGGWGSGYTPNPNNNSNEGNYFGISVITNSAFGSGYDGIPNSYADIPVAEAYAIDKKMDDGFPQSGRVTAMYVDFSVPGQTGVAWAAGSGNFGANSGLPSYGPTTTATPASSTTCYDNANSTAAMAYSMSVSSGANPNCALSFQFQ